MKINKKLNNKNWKRFHLYDDLLFFIDSGNKFDKSKMSMLNPTINLVSRSNNNNGISCAVDEISDIEPYEAGNMTLALGGEYLGSCFIQENAFYTSQNVNVLIPKWDMSDYIKRFISFIIFKESRLYYKAFDNELNRHIKTDFSILLPVDKNGIPDWNYMEEYIKLIEEQSKRRISIFEEIKGNHRLVDTTKFKPFIVGDLFEIKPTKHYNLPKKRILDNDENPVVSNSAYNNGVIGYSSLETTEKGNIITFSDTVDAEAIFYQDSDFIGFSHVQGLYPINEYKEKWSKYSLLYFVSIFKVRAKLKGFNFGNKFERKIASQLEVLLPVRENGKIDFEYMEKYMKDIEVGVINKIEILKNK